MRTAPKTPLLHAFKGFAGQRKTLALTTGLAVATFALGVLPAKAQNTVYNFDNLDGNGSYNDALNWDQGAVPNLATTNTAEINDNTAVTYTPGGDLVIANGGILEVTSGSFTQAGGNNYYQLNGNGTVLINGGTFSQGTASSNPFNVTGTGNALTVTGGAFNVTNNFSLSVGLTFMQSGGVVTAGGNETDFNSPTNTLSGGTFNTNLITGVNGAAGVRFNIAGGTLNLTGSTAIYGGGSTQYINFTPGSTGKITFTSGTFTVASVEQNFLNSGAVEFNGTIDTAASGYSDFSVVQNGANVTLSLVPEPSSIALTALAAFGMMGWMVRRRHSRTV